MSDTPEVLDLREHQGHDDPVDLDVDTVENYPDPVDLRLRAAPDADASEPSTSRRPDVAAAIMVFALVAIGLGVWWWTQRRGAEPATPTSIAASTPTPAVPVPQAPPLPSLDAMDPFLRALLGTLSTSPELLRWLATDDLIHQMVLAIDRVANGAPLPKNALLPIRPTRDFVVAGRAGAQQIDAASFRRFDGLVGAVAAVDAQKMATAYTTIRPRLDEAYRTLGRGPSIDAAVSAALRNLIDTPSVSLPVRVKPGAGVGYAYADQTLEALPPAQKLLLRLGPEHAETMKAKLREIKQAVEATGY